MVSIVVQVAMSAVALLFLAWMLFDWWVGVRYRPPTGEWDTDKFFDRRWGPRWYRKDVPMAEIPILKPSPILTKAELMDEETNRAILDWLLRTGIIRVDTERDAPRHGRLWAGTDSSGKPVYAVMPPFVSKRLREINDG